MTKILLHLSFSVKEKSKPLTILMNFIEKGYEFVLDADVTPGEQSDGTHKVFVEIERNKNIHKQVMEVMDGISKLSNEDDWRFRYYKNWQSTPLKLSSLEEQLPSDPNDYTISESNKLNNYKNFFNKSMVDNINLLNNRLMITKKYCQPLYFEFIDFGDSKPRSSKSDSTTRLNVNDFAEVIFLCKYVGDYNITKFGDKLTV